MSWVMSRTLDKFSIRYSCRQHSQMALIIMFWLKSHNLFRKTIACWFTRKEGTNVDRTSSTIRHPGSKLALLIANKKYSGILVIGDCKRLRTSWYRPFFESLQRTSTTSGELHTSMKTVGTSCERGTSLISCIRRLLRLKLKDLSFSATYAWIAFWIMVNWKNGFFHSFSRRTDIGICKFWGLLLLYI